MVRCVHLQTASWVPLLTHKANTLNGTLQETVWSSKWAAMAPLLAPKKHCQREQRASGCPCCYCTCMTRNEVANVFCEGALWCCTCMTRDEVANVCCDVLREVADVCKVCLADLQFSNIPCSQCCCSPYRFCCILGFPHENSLIKFKV